jgi:hypothetical protein
VLVGVADRGVVVGGYGRWRVCRRAAGAALCTGFLRPVLGSSPFFVVLLALLHVRWLPGGEADEAVLG